MTKALKARFTYAPPMSVSKLDDENNEVVIEAEPKLETNMITFCSNVLKVYTLGESSIDLRLSTSLNDKILDIVKVPTAPFVSKKQQDGLDLNRKSE